MSNHNEEYNILLLGETGSGKSTLINYLTNYFNNGTLSNLRVSIPTKYHRATENVKNSENNPNDSSRSQTSECTIYNFKEDGKIFNFIDTPGLSATEGSEQDDEHIHNIMKTATEKESLVAIIIVINGSQARATANVRNTLYRLKSSVPDIFLNNLVITFTNCSEFTVIFDLEQLKPWSILPENVYHMDNSAFCKPEESWSSNVCQRKIIELQWDMSMEEIHQLIQKLKQQGKKTTDVFEKLCLKRAEIKIRLTEILMQMKRFQDLQSLLGDTVKLNQQVASSDVQKYTNFKKTKEVPYVEFSRSLTEWLNILKQVPITTILAIATAAAGGLVAGLGVSLTAAGAISAIRGAVSKGLPTAIISGILNLFTSKKKSAEEVMQEAENICNQARNGISSVEADIALLKAALSSKVTEFQKCCEDLREVCSLFNFVDELRGTIEIMEKDAHRLTSMTAKADAEERISTIKRFINHLSKPY